MYFGHYKIDNAYYMAELLIYESIAWLIDMELYYSESVDPSMH